MEIIKKLFYKYRNSNIKKILSDPFGMIGFCLVLGVLLIAVFAPFIAPYSPNEIDVMNKLTGPSAKHWFGTDHLGRDVMSRIVFGSRVVLKVSVLTIAFGIVLGIFFGIMAGYSSDTIGSIFLVNFDIIKSFPPILFAMTMIAMTGPSMWMLIIIIGITRFPSYARLIRAETLRVKELDYVAAARAVGAPSFSVMFKHILPNVVGAVFIQAAMDIPVVITYTATLSFLGLGVTPPKPSWGMIIKTGYSYIRTSPWMVIFGGLALMLFTLGFTFLGESLRDNLDPKLQK